MEETSPAEFGIKDRFLGDSKAFQALIERWDKEIKFAGHAPEMVPPVVLETARVGLSNAGKSLYDQHVIAATTECAKELAPLPLQPSTLEPFKNCLRRAVR